MALTSPELEAKGKAAASPAPAPPGDAVPADEGSVLDGEALRIGSEAPVDRHRDSSTAAIEEQEEEQAPPRRFDRVPITARAPQFCRTLLRGSALYVGTGGLILEFLVEVLRGTALRVVLPTARGPLEVEGTVVWTRPHDGCVRHGVVFPAPKEPAFVRLVLEGNRAPADGLPRRRPG